MDQFVSFINESKIPFKLNKDGTITAEDRASINYKNNHILGVVACSFMKNEESGTDISIITQIFKSMSEEFIRKVFFEMTGRFENAYQPHLALIICEHIHQCKPALPQ